MSDAAYIGLASGAKAAAGNCFVDAVLLREHGVTDLDKRRVTPGTAGFVANFFVDGAGTGTVAGRVRPRC